MYELKTNLILEVQSNIGELIGLIILEVDVETLNTIELSFALRRVPNNTKSLAECLAELADWCFKVLSCDQLNIKLHSEESDQKGILNSVGFHESKGELSEDTVNTYEYKGLPIDKSKGLILTAGPSISQLEASYAYEATLFGWNSQWSNYLQELEKNFAEYIGVKHAIATSSCTGALHIALQALDIGLNDEVIVPDQTWVATASAVKYTGASPVFADVELDSWNLDPKSVEESITERTKAIVPVHMYGNPARMDKLLEIAEKYDLKVVEDAAPSIGATYQKRRTGSFGDFAGFSFQGAKLMVTGEGGMLVTDNSSLYQKAKKIWDQGRNSSSNRAFWIDENGLKYKMSNVQAAIGLGQLERIETLISMKRRIFSWYEKGLSGLDSIVLNKETKEAKSIYWMSSIRLLENSKLTRDQLRILLKSDGIDTRPTFPAISQYPIWSQSNIVPSTNSKLIGETGINLPSGVCLRKEEVSYICQRVKHHLG